MKPINLEGPQSGLLSLQGGMRARTGLAASDGAACAPYRSHPGRPGRFGGWCTTPFPGCPAG